MVMILHIVGAYYDRRKEECGLCDGYHSSLSGCHKCADAEEEEDRREEKIREEQRAEEEAEEMAMRTSEPCAICGAMGTQEQPLTERMCCAACDGSDHRMSIEVQAAHPVEVGFHADGFFFEGKADDALKKGTEMARSWLKERPAHTRVTIRILSVSWDYYTAVDISGQTDISIDKGGF